MFDSRRAKGIRREAAIVVREVLAARAKRYASMAAAAEATVQRQHVTSTPSSLADELLSALPKDQPAYFAGQRLPHCSATGIAIEAMMYGLDGLSQRPADQRLAASGLGLLLQLAHLNEAALNSADLAMLDVAMQTYVSHPIVVAMMQPASGASPAAA